MSERKKDCQCGARPVWMAERGVKKRGRPTGDAERLACPVCGNTTAAGTSREEIAREWNSAGWCGQGPAQPEYVPFGEEWRGLMGRMKKPDLVKRYADSRKEVLALADTVLAQRARIEALETECARLRVRRDRLAYGVIVDRLVQRGIVRACDAAGAKARCTAASQADGGKAVRT